MPFATRTSASLLLAVSLAAVLSGCKRPFPPNVSPPDVKPAPAGAILALGAVAPSTPPTRLPLDGEATVGGAPVACTGIGQTRLEPRWQAYPVRVEFSNARNEYLAGAQVALWDGAGRQLLTVQCPGPWVLIRPPPGAYRLEGRLLDVQAAPRSARFRPPAKGQIRLVLQFPDG
ncbi:hypothetical protein ACO2Q3_17060 [Caulobacter sp. KR2-114]|uniref:hypothetical protein n=1 Tax=Caulobacter sp. KR2-114 TaxID=3400912 RepID=UPI003C085028